GRVSRLAHRRHRAGEGVGQRLAVELRQRRLGVEGIDVRRAAVHEQPDDAPGGGGEVRLLRREPAGRGPGRRGGGRGGRPPGRGGPGGSRRRRGRGSHGGRRRVRGAWLCFGVRRLGLFSRSQAPPGNVLLCRLRLLFVFG